MRYWWVNQNKTFRHEFDGGYLWSPKRKSKNNHRNPFYDFMREVSPGDLILSFYDTSIPAIGVARSHAYEAPKPLEFGQAGAYWDKIGWRVDVRFVSMTHKLKPAQHMQILAPLLPARYAPLRANGHGLQSVYLTELPERLALALIDLIGHEARLLANSTKAMDMPEQPVAGGLVEWEEYELQRVVQDQKVPETTRQAIVLARRGQGLFKKNVLVRERACRITRVDRLEHLRASHCKPWRDSSNEERLSGENGLLLTPTMDHLFDRGFISFEGNGDLLISPVAHRTSLGRMGIELGKKLNVGKFSEGQRGFLDFHREFVFLEARNVHK